jgi:predicted DNA-binding transcriptional regulator AlpA
MDSHDNRGRLLNEAEVAAMLGVSKRTLQAWRQRRSDGPAYVKLSAAGRVRYRLDSVLAWIAEHTCRSTADAATRAA